MQFTKDLILGSKSPRRREILEMAGYTFTTEVYPTDEKYPDTLPAAEVAEYLAVQKSEAFRPLQANEVLVTCDTVVEIKGNILEKPIDNQHAFEMLNMLQGAVHRVYSGVCIRSVAQQLSFTDKTEVSIVEMDAAELNFYIEHYKPFDKAGSYGVQEWLGMVGVDYIRGSFYNVMGLPIHRLYKELQKFTH
ncbi:septum formation protein Maf [bacterium]|nr:septum formation protein Maf [bacterium]